MSAGGRDFFCDDMRAIGVEFECCSSCHGEWDDGYYSPSECWPEDEFLKTTLFHCCTCPKPTPEQWAKLKELK